MPQSNEGQAFIDRVTALPPGPGVSLEEVLRPSLKDEAVLRRLFATEKDHSRLKDPYVGLVDVFDAPADIRTIRARVVKDEEDLSAKYIMPLSEQDRKKDGEACIVPSLEDFQKNWGVFSEGSLSQLSDWSNVVAAGGSVLACLVPLPNEATVSKRAMRKFYHGTAYPTSDVDLFLWGLTPEQAKKKIVKIYEAVRDSVPWDVTCVRTKHTVSIHSQYPYRSIQIVLRLYSSPAEILAGFDIDAPCCAYDGSHVWANPRAITALMRQCNTVDVTRRSPSYEVRLTKYSSRSFEIHVPNLSRSDIDPTIYERSIIRVEGLARLLVFEKLKDADTRARFLESRRALRGRPGANDTGRYYRRKKALKGDLKNEAAIGGLEMNDYDVVSLHIPYGPGWDARRIDKLVYQTDLGMNSTFNPKNKDRRLHRHPAFFGTIEECMEDCCELCPGPIDNDERKLQEEEDTQYIRGRISFVEEDPGRQSLSGSFNPIDDTEWAAQVYIGPTEKFFRAIISGNRSAIAQMIAEGVDVNRRDHVGRMPLHVAVMAGQETIACDLIDAGARITSRLAEGRTALHCAVMADQLVVVRKLLERSKVNEELLKKEEDGDGDVEMKDAGEKERPSSEDDWSSDNGNGVVSMDEDGDGDDEDEGEDEDDGDGDSDNDDADDDQGVRKKATSEPPRTPAESSALPEDDDSEPDVFDINAPDWDLSFTPLIYAILFASLPVINEILDAGADINLVLTASYYDAPALHPLLATIYRQNDDEACVVIEQLLKAGAVSSSADESVQTILHKMVAAGKIKHVSTILRLDPNAKVVLGLPAILHRSSAVYPLLTAAEKSDYGMVATLLAYGAPVAFKEEEISQALEISRQLSSNNVSVYYHSSNYSGDDLDTTVHPIESGLVNHSDLLQLFVSLGAEINRAIKASTSRWVSPENLRSYLDYAKFGVASIDGLLAGLDEEDPIERRKRDAINNAASDWERAVATSIYLTAHGYLPDSEKHKEKLAEDKKNAERSKREYLQLKGFFGDVERLFVSKRAKTYNEIFPNAEKPSTATATAPARNQSFEPPHKNRYYLLGQSYQKDPVPASLNEVYNELFEACFAGDNATVRRLCLPEEGTKKALQMAVEVAHPDNIYQTSQITPLTAAIQGRHWSTARLVFGICVAQYVPIEQAISFKLGSFSLYDDDDDDDDEGGSEASDDTVPAKKQNRPLFNAAQRSLAAKSQFDPKLLLEHRTPYVIDDKICQTSQINRVIAQKDVEGFVNIANLYTLVEPQVELGEQVLNMIIQEDQPDMLDEFIRRTGSGIDMETQDTDEEAAEEIRAVNDKNKVYLGLSVHGKKRKDLAKKNDPSATHEQPQSTVPLLWRAIQQKSRKIVEYLASTRPLEAYRFFAMTNSNEEAIRLRRMTDLEKVLPARLGWCINSLGESPLTAAALAGNLDILKMLFGKDPKLMSAALKERLKFSGYTALMIAIQAGCDVELADYLIANGQSAVETDHVRRWNIYHMMANRHHAELFKHFLQKLPRDVNEALLLQQAKGSLNTPLHLALSNWNYPIVTAIIDYTRAALTLRNVYGSIPLHMAVKNGTPKTVQKLIEASPTECLHLENGVGNTVLEVAMLSELFERVTEQPIPSLRELAQHMISTSPPRIVLEKLKDSVPALRRTIKDLSENGPLNSGEKLFEELSKFARLMETKLAIAQADAAALAEKDGAKKKEEEEAAPKTDSQDIPETLRIVREAVLARPGHRQLVHLIDVQKSVGGDLKGAGAQPRAPYWRQHRERDEDGLEPEEDAEDNLRNTSMVYRNLGVPTEDASH